MKEFNRSSIFSGALFVLALIALLPGRSAMADEWNEVSQSDARISLVAPSLSEASVDHARRKVTYGIAERGSWVSPAGLFPRAEVYAEILKDNARFTSKIDLKDGTKNWHFLQGKTLKFGDQNSYWNGLGQGKYSTFNFQGHECVAFRQFWGMIAETRGVDAGTRMLFGYYCGPSGVSLSEQTIESVLDSIRVRSSGKLTAETNPSQTTEDFDGRWIFEITDLSNKSSTDSKPVEIKDNKFTVKVLTNGWRGQLSGEIDKYGWLVGQGKVSRLGWGGQNVPIDFAAKYGSGGFQDDVIAGPRALATFRIKLTRAADDGSFKVAASSQVESQGVAPSVEPPTESADYHDGLRAFESGDYGLAAHEWLISASQGDITSQFRLAQLYEQGLGVPQDFVQAHRWYNIAGSQGHAEAREARDALGNRMTANQLAEAQNLATETSLLSQDRLNQLATPSVDQGSALAPRDISRFDGHWKASGRTPSSQKIKCGFAMITVEIYDGQVSGKLRLVAGSWHDSATGDYPFSGVVDPEGNMQAKGKGLSVVGTVSDETSIVRGSWAAFGPGCKGTYEGRKDWEFRP